MTPDKNHCISEQFVFGQDKSCPLVVNFQGEPVTSDAGLTLIAELDRKKKITSRFAACFKDYRKPNKVVYPVHNLVAQRIYGLIMRYEDINDHEILRKDPIFALAVATGINSQEGTVELAGKSTLNRLEHCPEDVDLRENSRYHRIESDESAIETLLVELFLDSHQKPPRQIIIDLDVTDDMCWEYQKTLVYFSYHNQLSIVHLKNI